MKNYFKNLLATTSMLVIIIVVSLFFGVVLMVIDQFQYASPSIKEMSITGKLGFVFFCIALFSYPVAQLFSFIRSLFKKKENVK